MGFLDDVMKLFTGGDDSPSIPTSLDSSPKKEAWVNPEPGRYPPIMPVPEPKRKMVLTDLKPEQLKGKR